MWSHCDCAPPAITLTRSCARRTLFSALLSLAPLAAACGDATSPGPAPSTQLSAPRTPPAPPPPTITGPAILYQRASPTSYGQTDAYLLSLGPDSAFTIIFPDGERFWGWSGRYQRADSLLVFHYNARSAAGELRAEGTVRGDTLVLRYNTLMQLTDFEDGVYLSIRQ